MTMGTRNVRYYGAVNDLPERIALRAGPLSLLWEESDLRTIKFEGVEVLRRIYIAIRDRNWGTVPNTLSNVQMVVEQDSFLITFDAANAEGDIDFTWQGRVSGSAEGEITYSMVGRANTTFWKSRIGFCVLHPADAAGAACHVEHVDGSTDMAALPVHLVHEQPVTPFAEMAALTHEIRPGIWFETRFAGDIFEMEDQRNWTDASFKTFSTPLRIPYPVELPAGTAVVQTLTLRLIDKRPEGGIAQFVAEDRGVQFGPIAGAPATPLPAIGLGMASHGQMLTEHEVAALTTLNLDHLRVDIHPISPSARDVLVAASQAARALGTGLHVAVFLDVPYAEQVQVLESMLEDVKPPVEAWLLYPAHEDFRGGTPIVPVVEAAKLALKRYADVPLGAGTDTDFIFLLRNRPPLHSLDFITYAINPQVHAFDNTSLIETVACQAATVRSARLLSDGLPVHVSPVTLRMRYNPYATAAPQPPPPGELPPQVDVRQMSLFGAGWTLGSIKYLAESGAEAVTYYETTGWRGVMEQAGGSPIPEKFRSIAGGVFPLFHVLADIGDLRHAQVIPTRATDPLVVDGLLLEEGGRRTVLLYNATPSMQAARVEGLSGHVACRLLDERTADQAAREPEAFRASFSPLARTGDGYFEVPLSPYAYARLDVSE